MTCQLRRRLVAAAAVTVFATTLGQAPGGAGNAAPEPGTAGSPAAPTAPVAGPAAAGAVGSTAAAAAVRPGPAGRASRSGTGRAGVAAPAEQAGLAVRARPRTGARRAGVSPAAAKAVARKQLAARGWSGQYGCLERLWAKESRWNVLAGRPNGSYGIPQANPGRKMRRAGPGWRNDAATQISWGLGYIAKRYGSPCAAWRHWQRRNWY